MILDNEKGFAKAFYYYIRDRGNHPVITVCLLVLQDNPSSPIRIFRGVTICSEEDNVCKSVGRVKALSRALFLSLIEPSLHKEFKHKMRIRGKTVIDLLHRGVGKGFGNFFPFYSKAEEITNIFEIERVEIKILRQAECKLPEWLAGF